MQAYVFKQQKVQALLKKAIADHVEGQQYDPVKGSKVSGWSLHLLPWGFCNSPVASIEGFLPV